MKFFKNAFLKAAAFGVVALISSANVASAQDAAPGVAGNAWRNSIGMEFRRIPAGTFKMGSPTTEVMREHWGSDETQREVTISREFYMSVYETRQRDWEAAGGKNLSFFRGADRPIERVSFKNAQRFVEVMNQKYGEELEATFGEGARYDLPTEAQWEYACRAGTKTTYSFGDSCDGSQANVNGKYPYPNRTAPGDYVGGTTAVGMYPPNAWGLYDMHGNVWEWTLDWYAPYDGKNTVDPVNLTGRGVCRVLRGGSWAASAFCARSAHRVNDSDVLFSDNAHNVGFRLVIIPGDKKPLLKIETEWTREQVESSRRRYELKNGIE